ncbi:MAG: ribonuclease P protein component [Eubacteriales bacterium]|jgi:ribonuclease P protein component
MDFSESLKKNTDFRRVYRKGASAADRCLVMYVLENQTERNRIGISVSKKVGNSVVRHRLTRLVREAYRLRESDFSGGLDIVIVVRTAARGKKEQEIEQSLCALARRHHIMRDKE